MQSSRQVLEGYGPRVYGQRPELSPEHRKVIRESIASSGVLWQLPRESALQIAKI